MINGQHKKLSAHLSCKITRLMFILSVLVVYIHMYDAQYTDASFYGVRVLEDLVSQGICRVAVPLFLMISGYLHFSRTELTERILLKTLRGKISTLVIPYFLWNVIYLLYAIACAVLTNRAEGMIDLPFILKGIFLYDSNGAFWYVFQLIMLCVISPLLLKLYRNKCSALVALSVFFVMYLFIEKNTKWFLLPGLFFFSLGAVCAIHFRKAVDRELWSESAKKWLPAMGAILLMLLMIYRVWIMDVTVNISDLRDTVSYRLFEGAAAIAFWYAADVVKLGNRKPCAIEKDSFFIYATHGIVLSVCGIVINKMITITPLSRTVLYLIVPIITVAIILATASCMKKCMPGIYKQLSGGR